MTIATATATQTRVAAKMTVDDYLALPESEYFQELVDGVLEQLPNPGVEHQCLLGSLYAALYPCLKAATPRPGVAFCRVAVAFSQFRLVVPDLVYVRMERRHLLRNPILKDAPDLVVEILSQDRAKDLIRNRRWYADAGIPEYWILDPVNDTLTILELSGNQYTERAVLGRNDTLTTPTLPGLTIPLTELFDDPDRALLHQP